MSKNFFISHAVKDKEIADTFVDVILDGALSVPIDEMALIEHNEYNSKILEEIKKMGITVSFLMIRENFFLIKKT